MFWNKTKKVIDLPEGIELDGYTVYHIYKTSHGTVKEEALTFVHSGNRGTAEDLFNLWYLTKYGILPKQYKDGFFIFKKSKMKMILSEAENEK